MWYKKLGRIIMRLFLICAYRDVKVLELLYEEAKYNVLEGRYPCDISQYIMLGGIQARLELGPFNPQVHTNKFFRYVRDLWRFSPFTPRIGEISHSCLIHFSGAKRINFYQYT